MLLVKDLEWTTKIDDGQYGVTSLCVDPEGLRWAYRIIYPVNDNNKFELVLIDNNGCWDEELTTFHNTIELAQDYANEHYKNIIIKHIISMC